MKSVCFKVIYGCVCLSVCLPVCDSNNYRRGHEFVGNMRGMEGVREVICSNEIY